MSDNATAGRRTRVERNIYLRTSGTYEVGFRDGTGKQRWRSVNGGITAARALRTSSWRVGAAARPLSPMLASA